MCCSSEKIAAPRGPKGMALLTVLVAMMIISLMLFEFQYNTMVERKLAFNDLNHVQAYYLAKSGVRLGLLRVALYGRLQNDPNVKNVKGSFPVQNYLNMIWSIPVPPFPPDRSSFSDMLKADRDAAETALKQTQIEEGQYSHTIASESNKINLNFLIDTRQDKGQPISFNPPCNELFCYVGASLVNLMEGFLRDSPDPFAEFGNLNPEEVVYNIMDWISPGGDSYAGVDKDAFYETLNPPYRAKRNRFYTVEELRLVRGVDDALFRKLRPHVTVYSYDGRININTMSRDVLRALDPDLPEQALDDFLQHRAEIGSFPDVGAFINYISSTLGYSAFKDKFDNPDDYFTVGSESFLIESLGVIKKSASQVQRSMKVAVALVRSSKAGQIVPNVANEADCKKGNDRFWDNRTRRCLYRPSNAEECQQKLAGTWDETQNCCKINNIPECVPVPGAAGSGTSGEPGKASRVEPNAMKILHWSES